MWWQQISKFMKTLTLVRHAKSSWDGEGVPDFYRPLKPTGIEDAVRVSRFVKNKQELFPDWIVTSPAVRALSTAIVFAREMGVGDSQIKLESGIYESSKEQIAEVIKRTDDSVNSLMVFGHDYSLTDFANFICAENLDKNPTAGVISVRLNINSWKEVDYGTGQITFFITPKKLLLKY